MVVAVRANDTLGQYEQPQGSGAKGTDTHILGEVWRRSNTGSIQSVEAHAVPVARSTEEQRGQDSIPRQEEYGTQAKAYASRRRDACREDHCSTHPPSQTWQEEASTTSHERRIQHIRAVRRQSTSRVLILSATLHNALHGQISAFKGKGPGAVV